MTTYHFKAVGESQRTVTRELSRQGMATSSVVGIHPSRRHVRRVSTKTGESLRKRGCEVCFGVGYRARLGILRMMNTNEAISALMMAGAAKRNSMPPDEVVRVTQEFE